MAGVEEPPTVVVADEVLAVVDLWRATDVEWQAHLARAFLDTPGQSVADVTTTEVCGLLNFAQGSVDVVHDDLRRILPPDVAARAAEVLRQRGLDDAFTVRRELVNYKKACLNIYRAAAQLDRDLRQLATFFRGQDDDERDGFFVHSKVGRCKLDPSSKAPSFNFSFVKRI